MELFGKYANKPIDYYELSPEKYHHKLSQENQKLSFVKSPSGYERIDKNFEKKGIGDDLSFFYDADRYTPSSKEPIYSKAEVYHKINGKLYINGVSENDVIQGDLGNCYFLASIAAIARTNPEIIQKAIKDNGDGTYTVTFYENGKPVQVTVDNVFPTKGDRFITAKPAESIEENGKYKPEMWVMILEKAWAKYKGKGEYDKTSGGSLKSEVGLVGQMDGSLGRTSAMSFLTGKKTRSINPKEYADEEIMNYIEKQLNQKNAITATTNLLSQNPEKNIVGAHVYAVVGVDKEKKTVRLYNPHGNYVDLSIQDFKKHFFAMDINGAKELPQRDIQE